MKELLNIISQNEEIGHGEAADARKVALAKLDLKQKGFAIFPDDFAELLKSYNGLCNDGHYVLAVEPTSNYFDDIVKFNEHAFLEDKQNCVIIGYDEFDYVVYNQKSETYQILDRYDGEIREETKDLSDAIGYILKI